MIDRAADLIPDATRKGVRGGPRPLDLAPDNDYKERLMWSWADRMVKAVSNVTVGTVIVLVHVALAERNRRLQTVVPPDRRIVN